MVDVYDSKQKKIISEHQFGGDVLVFLYNTTVGRFLLKVIFSQTWFWSWAALLQKRRSTITRVHDYIDTYSIDRNEYVDSDWRSFYDFFSRQFKPGIINFPKSSRDVISIAEAKLLTAPISRDLVVTIKNRKYTIASILGSAELAAEYEGGTALVYRLSVNNYHRYLFPDKGVKISTTKHKGVLHTVSSIAGDYPVYSINKREVSQLDCVNFGKVVMVEIGAMMVGSIMNYSLNEFERGNEKGYFELGGSSILLLYKKATVKMSKEIQEYSQQGIEVTVSIGEGIGKHV